MRIILLIARSITVLVSGCEKLVLCESEGVGHEDDKCQREPQETRLRAVVLVPLGALEVNRVEGVRANT